MGVPYASAKFAICLAFWPLSPGLSGLFVSCFGGFIIGNGYMPYSRKYWQEINLAVGPKIAIAKILAVWYRIAI